MYCQEYSDFRRVFKIITGTVWDIIIIVVLLLFMPNYVLAQIPLNENTTVYLNDGKTKTFQLSSGLNYSDDDGATWKPHDFKIINLGGGQYGYKAGYEFTTGAYYDNMFQIKNKELYVTFRPLLANHAHGSISGNQVNYNNVYTDINATRFLRARGIKEYLYVASSSAPDSFVYIYTTNADAIKQNLQGFVFSLNNRKIIIPKLEYWDANKLQKESIDYDFKTVAGNKIVIMRIDYSDMTFPVTIDPTTSFVDTSLYTDTYINEAAATTNYHTNVSMAIKSGTSGGNQQRSLLKYDLSSIFSDSIISFACSLYINNRAGSGGWQEDSWRLNFRKMVDNYNYALCNWNTKDGSIEWTGGQGRGYSLTDTALTGINRNKSNNVWVWISQDSLGGKRIQQQLTNWMIGSNNYGWMIMYDSVGYDSTGTVLSQNFTFDSENGTNKPRLWITVRTLTPCSLALGDTNAVSVKIDSIKGIRAGATRFGIANNTYGKFYRIISGAEYAEMADTMAVYLASQWQGIKVPLKANTKNYLVTYTTITSKSMDTTHFQFQQVGSPTLGMSFTSRDSLWFVMYDTTNRIYKFLPVDSLLNWEQPFYANQWYANSFSLLPDNIMSVFNNWAWRREIN